MDGGTQARRAGNRLARLAQRALPPRAFAALRFRLRPDEVALVRRVLPSGLPSAAGRPADLVLIDVGAHEGESFLPFAEDGWNVFAFEPDPVNRRRLVNASKHLATVALDPRAVSNAETEAVPFFRNETSTGISSLAPFHPDHERAGTVATVTLGLFCEEAGIEHIDLLKIDAEGHDLFVLEGVPWERIQPRAIVCEFEDAKTRPLGWTFHDEAGFLRDRGYHVMVSEWYPVEAYGGPHRWRRFMPYPCELADPRAWGNLIALAEGPDFAALHDLCFGLGTPWRLVSALRAWTARAARRGGVGAPAPS